MVIKKINDLSLWLVENQDDLDNSIIKTDCYKWTRKHGDNSVHVFPCVCSVRNKECIFIETYYEVQKAWNLLKKEQECINALEQFNQIKHNRNAIFEWVRSHEGLAKPILHFKPIVTICVSPEPYQVQHIQLPENQFKNLLKFKEIFTEYYYSSEYEDY